MHDDDAEATEKIKDLELDIEDAVEKTDRTKEKITSVARTITNIRYSSTEAKSTVVSKTMSLYRTGSRVRIPSCQLHRTRKNFWKQQGWKKIIATSCTKYATSS